MVQFIIAFSVSYFLSYKILRASSYSISAGILAGTLGLFAGWASAFIVAWVFATADPSLFPLGRAFLGAAGKGVIPAFIGILGGVTHGYQNKKEPVNTAGSLISETYYSATPKRQDNKIQRTKMASKETGNSVDNKGVVNPEMNLSDTELMEMQGAFNKQRDRINKKVSPPAPPAGPNELSHAQKLILEYDDQAKTFYEELKGVKKELGIAFLQRIEKVKDLELKALREQLASLGEMYQEVTSFSDELGDAFFEQAKRLAGEFQHNWENVRFDHTSGLPTNYKEQLENLRDEYVSRGQKIKNPFDSPELNEAYQQISNLGPEAREEFKAVVAAVGNRVDAKSIKKKIEEKFKTLNLPNDWRLGE